MGNISTAMMGILGNDRATICVQPPGAAHKSRITALLLLVLVLDVRRRILRLLLLDEREDCCFINSLAEMACRPCNDFEFDIDLDFDGEGVELLVRLLGNSTDPPPSNSL